MILFVNYFYFHQIASFKYFLIFKICTFKTLCQDNINENNENDENFTEMLDFDNNFQEFDHVLQSKNNFDDNFEIYDEQDLQVYLFDNFMFLESRFR